MQLAETPDRPWQVLHVASDLSVLNNQKYEILVDYYFKYFGVTHIPDGRCENVIQILKPHFTRHRILEKLRTENGLEYSSLDFKQFTNKYGVNHVTSPTYAQSKGMAERTVQTVNTLIKKQRRRTDTQN